MDGILFGMRALVTGGTSGIGRAIALALADAGANIIATGVTKEEIQRFDSAGRTINAVQLDVTKEQEIDSAVTSLDTIYQQENLPPRTEIRAGEAKHLARFGNR